LDISFDDELLSGAGTAGTACAATLEEQWVRLKPADNGCTLGAGCRALNLIWLLCRSAWSMSGAGTLSCGSYTGMPNLVSVQVADHSCICPRFIGPGKDKKKVKEGKTFSIKRPHTNSS